MSTKYARSLLVDFWDCDGKLILYFECTEEHICKAMTLYPKTNFAKVNEGLFLLQKQEPDTQNVEYLGNQ